MLFVMLWSIWVLLGVFVGLEGLFHQLPFNSPNLCAARVAIAEDFGFV